MMMNTVSMLYGHRFYRDCSRPPGEQGRAVRTVGRPPPRSGDETRTEIQSATPAACTTNSIT